MCKKSEGMEVCHPQGNKRENREKKWAKPAKFHELFSLTLASMD